MNSHKKNKRSKLISQKKKLQKKLNIKQKNKKTRNLTNKYKKNTRHTKLIIGGMVNEFSDKFSNPTNLNETQQAKLINMLYMAGSDTNPTYSNIKKIANNLLIQIMLNDITKTHFDILFKNKTGNDKHEIKNLNATDRDLYLKYFTKRDKYTLFGNAILLFNTYPQYFNDKFENVQNLSKQELNNEVNSLLANLNVNTNANENPTSSLIKSNSSNYDEYSGDINSGDINRNALYNSAYNSAYNTFNPYKSVNNEYEQPEYYELPVHP
jgi:hypothetical protein